MLLEQLASLSDDWSMLQKLSCFCLKKLNHISTVFNGILDALFSKIWLKRSPCVLHGLGKVRIFPESDLLKWGASYMPGRPICRQIR